MKLLSIHSNLTQGFFSSQLIILAGRPSMGKTAFALNIARNVAVESNKNVLTFSLEMSKQQLIYRLLSSEASISHQKLKAARVNANEWKDIYNTITFLSSYDIYINDDANVSIRDISHKCRKFKHSNKDLGLIVIDYLQLIEAETAHNNRVQELSSITRKLKALARELEVPILVLSQLSRSVESRVNKRPLLSDLRESGCVAQDTNVELSNSTSTNIKNLYKASTPVFSADLYNNQIISLKDYKLYYSGKKYVYLVTTDINFKVKVTSDHKLLTANGWKRTDALNAKEELFFVQNNQIKYGAINSISFIGKEEVYDLSLPLTKNFIANGVIVHNSIEQDADLVLMLYRDDYYYPNTPTPNIAELIIAKHRNGPLGSVKLYFDSKFTRFFTISSQNEV